MRKRWFTVVLVLLAAAFVASASGAKEEATAEGELKKATLRLNWKITGPHTAYYLGHHKGFFEDEGIDMEIMEGSGSGTAAQLVANRQDTFGLADAAALIPLVEKGLPIKCVGMITPKTSLAVIARKDSGIRTLQDLEGKSLAVTAGDSLTQIWPAVVAANNLDESKINLVYVDAAAKVPVVLEKKADALLGSSADQFFILQGKGVPAVAIEFADNGVNVLNLGLWVHKDLIEEDPEIIEACLRAVKRSYEALKVETDLGVKLLVEAKPELDVQTVENQTAANLAKIQSPNCPDSPFLFNCQKDWEMTQEIMTTYRGITASMEATDYYTNEFIPEE